MNFHSTKNPPLSDLHAMLAKIGRERHPHRINRIINDPSIYEWVRGRNEGTLDLSHAVANPANVLLMGQHGGVFFVQLEPGLYEAHTQVLPDGRGEWCVIMVRAALHWMFTRTEAFEIMTRCPQRNVPARALAVAIGGKKFFRNPAGWTMNGEPVSADIYCLQLTDWLMDAPGLEERGEWFYMLQEDERYARGYKKSLTFAPFHKRHIGLACEMVLHGQAIKAKAIYDRFARVADHAIMDVCSVNPTAINLEGSMAIVRENGDFYLASIKQ